MANYSIAIAADNTSDETEEPERKRRQLCMKEGTSEYNTHVHPYAII